MLTSDTGLPHQSTSIRRFLSWASPLEWVCLLVGGALVLRYRWILDDSTVYFRYVDNLLFLKRGLVYNEGEFVEGFSSPLWLLVLVPFRAVRLDYWTITTFIACLAWLGFWAAAVHVNRLFRQHTEASAVNIPLVLIATAYGPLSYFSSGSEAPLMQLAAACVALYAVSPHSVAWQVLLGALPLVRNEFIIPLGVLIAYRTIVSRRVPWPIVASGMSLGLTWLLFRVYYYADFFPCPFYLKDKVAMGQGLRYLANGFFPYGLTFLLVFGAGALIWLFRIGDRDSHLSARCLMWLTACSSLAYVVKVGGDMMHYRMIAFPFCVIALSVGGLVERVLSNRGIARSWALRTAVGLAMGAASFLVYPRFLSKHPVLGGEERTLQHGISDAPWHRYHPALVFSSVRQTEDKARLAAYREIPPTHSSVTTDVFCAGIFANPKVRYVHGYGLTEPVLARVNAPEERPGHKARLVTLARDLVTLRRRDSRTQSGVVESAMRDGRVPQWIRDNADTVTAVERRMYNEHRFFENLRIALSGTGRLHLSGDSK